MADESNEDDISGAFTGKLSNEPKGEQKDDEDKGVSPRIKNLKALVTGVMVPIGGLLIAAVGAYFAYLKILTIELDHRIDEAGIERKIEEEKSKTGEALKAAADSDEKASQHRAEQAKTEFDHFNAEQSAKRAELEERHQSEEENRLYGAIAKAENAKTTEDIISSITTLRIYLHSPNPTFKRIALRAMRTRLVSANSPTEVELLCDSLVDAGQEGLAIAIFANQRARQLLNATIRANDEPATLDALSLLTTSRTGAAYEELSFHVHKVVIDHKLNGAHGPDLAVVVAMLRASRDAIAGILPLMPKGSQANLDDCFLPNFYMHPSVPIQANEISLRGTYLVGADLRSLERPTKDGPKITFGTTPQGSARVKLDAPDPDIPPENTDPKSRLLSVWKAADVQMTERQEKELICENPSTATDAFCKVEKAAAP